MPKSSAEAANTIPKQCSSLRKSEYVVLKGRPCKIVDMSTAKPGKHGHAKIHFVGLDVFTSKKYEEIYPSSRNVEAPIVVRKDYQVIYINEDLYFSLMDNDGSTCGHIQYDAKVCSQAMQDIKKLEEECEASDDFYLCATSLIAMGDERIIEVKKKSFTQKK